MSDIPEVYSQVIERIRDAANESVKATGFGVFHGKRISDGEDVYLLAYVEKLDKNGKPTVDTEMSIIAEFLPNKPTKDLYNLKDFWIVEEEEEAPPPPPLPKNVFQFKKKR